MGGLTLCSHKGGCCLVSRRVCMFSSSGQRSHPRSRQVSRLCWLLSSIQVVQICHKASASLSQLLLGLVDDCKAIISVQPYVFFWNNVLYLVKYVSTNQLTRLCAIIGTHRHIEKIIFVSLLPCLVTSRPFLKTAGVIVSGSVAVSAISAVSADVLPYISVAIKASFLKLGMCNIYKNNIAKMFLDFLKILNCLFDRRFLNF